MYKPDNTGKVRVVQEATSVKSPAIWFALHIHLEVEVPQTPNTCLFSTSISWSHDVVHACLDDR